MFESIHTKIGETLSRVTQVKEYFYVPKSKLDKFPCVFYKPLGLTNNFESNLENMKVYRFLILVIVGTSGTDVAHAFGTVLPKTVDAIIAQFDAEWDMGTIDGHRITAKLEASEAWEVSEEQDGVVCYAPLTLSVRGLTG